MTAPQSAPARDRRDRHVTDHVTGANPRRYWDVTHVTGFSPARVYVTRTTHRAHTFARPLTYTRIPLSRLSRVSRASVYAGFTDAPPVTYPVTRAPTLSRDSLKEKRAGEKNA